MKINELFTGGNKWNWDYNSPNEAEATFVVGEIQYKFYAYSSEQGIWEVEFKVMEGGNPGNRFGITGTGNASLVMSTVTDILREFLAMYKGSIKSLNFSADERSRQALYARMAKRLLPNWDLTQNRKQFVLTAPEDLKMTAEDSINEWQESDLYHATSISSMLQIWHKDQLGFNSNVSTTRNYNYALGYLTSISKYGSAGGVIFTLNQDLLRRDIGRRRMPGTDWFKGEPPDSSSDEFQRRDDSIDTDRFETLIKGGLKPFRKYVKKIQIWLPKKRTIKPTPPGEHPMYRHSYKPGDDPDQHYDVSVNNELMQNNWFKDPVMKATWDAVLRDPRTEVKQELGHQKAQHNVPVRTRNQYGPDHQLYDPSKDEHR